jgi:hypothetical protein
MCHVHQNCFLRLRIFMLFSRVQLTERQRTQRPTQSSLSFRPLQRSTYLGFLREGEPISCRTTH